MDAAAVGLIHYFPNQRNQLTRAVSSQVDMDDGLRIWRSFKMGKLMDLVMIDTRQYDRSITHLDLGRPGSLSMPL